MNKSILFLPIIAIAIGLFIYVAFKQEQTKQNGGMVIILNGPSAAGKSSIQKAFQDLMMPSLWLKVGIDNLFDGPMPDITLDNIEYWQKPNAIRWVISTKDVQENNVITLFTGEQGQKVAYAMNNAIVAYAKSGCNIIVDYIAYKQEWLKDLQQKLKPFNTLYIAVDISLQELERRESARGTSPAGHARSHYDTVYGSVQYDARVNSEHNSAQEIAEQIKTALQLK